MNSRPTDPTAFVELSEAECLERLKGAPAGYLATTSRALPVVVPVALTPADHHVLLTPVFANQASLVEQAVVALAVGDLSREPGSSWSVVAQGTLRAAAGLGAEPGRVRPGPVACCAFEAEVLSGWRETSAAEEG